MLFLTQGKTNWKYIIVIVILAIIASGGIWWLSVKKEVSFREPQEAKKGFEEEKMGVEEALSLCNKIDAKGDRELCTIVAKGEGEKCQDEECYYNVALRNQDPSLCKNISAEQSRLLCEIFTSRDSTRCETLYPAFVAPSCYYYMATYTKDLKACEKSGEASFLCKATITGDSSWCEQVLTSTNRDICYLQVGAIKGDSALCENIINPTRKRFCQKVAERDISGLDCGGKEAELCISVAILKDPSICEKTSFPGECYNRVILFEMGVTSMFPLVKITPEME